MRHTWIKLEPSMESLRLANVVACMGGWGCSQRNGCAHYLTENRANPVERLCGRIEEPEPIKEQNNGTETPQVAHQA
jgi:hypothetical protein